MSDTDRTKIEISVDTFNDGDAFFVRTEIEARAVTIHGPFADLASAQKLKAQQLARRQQVSETLKQQMQHTASSLAGTG
jgi:hypothetical protein